MLDLNMGAYGGFVWGAWGITALVIAGLVVRVVADARLAAKVLRDLEDEAS